MEINNQNELENITTSPKKLNCNKYFLEFDKTSSYYQKIISEFIFYFLQDGSDKSINEDIELICHNCI